MASGEQVQDNSEKESLVNEHKNVCPCILARQILFSGPGDKFYCSKEDVPTYLHMKFLQSGYRVHFSWRQCLASMFALHNETINIWTAVPGVLIFSYFTILFAIQTQNDKISTMYTLFGDIPPLGAADFFIFFAFFVCAILSYFASSLFHIFMCVSPSVFVKLHQFDYAGIACLIAGSFFPPIYYTFHCEQNLVRIYLIAISCIAAIGSLAILDSRFHQYKSLRVGVFVSYAAFGLFPIAHLIIGYGWQDRVVESLARIFLMYGTYGAGVFFYASRIPERCAPGKFDIWCHSHQIWHLFVLAGTLVHYVTCLYMMNDFNQNGCIPKP